MFLALNLLELIHESLHLLVSLALLKLEQILEIVDCGAIDGLSDGLAADDLAIDLLDLFITLVEVLGDVTESLGKLLEDRSQLSGTIVRSALSMSVPLVHVVEDSHEHISILIAHIVDWAEVELCVVLS